MSKTLSEIRIKIDKIDDKVHDLLMERASLVSSIAEAKRKSNLQVVQPAREARMIRRLLARHKGPLPKATVIRIWRELVGSVSLLQTGLSVVVASHKDEVVTSHFWDSAKNYFGSVVPMKKTNSYAGAIAAVRNQEASFAVLPWPELDENSAWWTHLFEQHGEKMNIICALPFGNTKKDSNLSVKSIVISKFDFLPSEDDVTFLGLELSSSISRTKIIDILSKSGLVPINLYSSRSPKSEQYSMHLVETSGYVRPEDSVINELKLAFDSDCLYCDVLGGYPAVPEYE